MQILNIKPIKWNWRPCFVAVQGIAIPRLCTHSPGTASCTRCPGQRHPWLCSWTPYQCLAPSQVSTQMKQHWQLCLIITLVAQGTQVSRLRGRGRQLSIVGGSKSSPLAGSGNSSHNDAPSTSAQTIVFSTPMDDCVMEDVEFAGIESDDET